MHLNFHSDPGHGWLEVPTDLVRQLNLAGRISQFSYLSRDMGTAFLEEDCDAPIVIQALKERGHVLSYREVMTNDKSFIRDLPRFRA